MNEYGLHLGNYCLCNMKSIGWSCEPLTLKLVGIGSNGKLILRGSEMGCCGDIEFDPKDVTIIFRPLSTITACEKDEFVEKFVPSHKRFNDFTSYPFLGYKYVVFDGMREPLQQRVEFLRINEMLWLIQRGFYIGQKVDAEYIERKL